MLPIIGLLSPIIGKVLDKIPDAGKKAELELELQKLLMENEDKLRSALIQSDTNQTEINKIEAASDSRFKSLARPTAMWICVVGFGISILFPYFAWILTVCGVPVSTPPPLPSEVLNTMLFGLLGLGAYRSFDKFKGTN